VSARRGFTLIEMVIALALSTLVVVALAALTVPLARAQVSAARGQTAQVNMSYASGLVERELRQASWIRVPTAANAPSAVLEGCTNAYVPPGASLPQRVDPARPMRWFAFCSDARSIHYHTGADCPAVYACGDSPAFSFAAGGDSTAGATFTRPSALSGVIEATLSLRSRDSSAAATSAVALAAAAGRNQ
jgi:prepilin-type N-terminal cleavage/methylation domain-containing protein